MEESHGSWKLKVMRNVAEHVGLWACRPKMWRCEGRPGGYPQVRTRGLAIEDEEVRNIEVMGRRDG